VVDLCCGVGFSTRALKLAFKESAAEIVGVDTSSEMVAMAKFITSHIQAIRPYFGIRRQHCLKETEFTMANAENTNLKTGSYDLVTVMYAMHEAPKEGRSAILKEARRLLKTGGTLAVVDISTDYQPSPSMLMGEPYVQEYQANIHYQLKQFAGFNQVRYETLIPNHLGMWTLRRAAFA
jgi:ubiquinone/menaquinone biosynthesis C-methylase UbiE